MIQGAKSGGLLPVIVARVVTTSWAEHAGCGHHHTGGQRADQHNPEAGQGQYESRSGWSAYSTGSTCPCDSWG